MMKLKVAAKVLLESDGKLLLAGDPNGKWDFPGGGIEGDETLPQALAREMLEETGITDYQLGEVIHADEWFIQKLGLHVIAVFYKATVAGQPEPVKSDEHGAFAWLTPDEIRGYDVTPDTLRALGAFLA